MYRDREEATFGATAILITAFVVVLLGIVVWFFAYRPAETTVTRVEVEDQQPDVEIVPVPQREVVPVPVPGQTRTIERERTIIQPTERVIEREVAPPPAVEEEAPDTVGDGADDATVTDEEIDTTN